MSEWKNGLCGCFSNCGICVVAYFVPCYTAGKNAESVGDSCIAYGLLQLVPIANFITVGLTRQKIREQKSIAGSLGADIVLSWCCYCCVLVQSRAELEGAVPGSQVISRS